MKIRAESDPPLVSLFIPTFNRAAYLDDCLYSVLCQDFKDYEIVIRDNNSTDDTKSVVDKYQHLFNLGANFRYIHSKTNVGYLNTMRVGVTKDCHGKYCLALHDDDFFINKFTLSTYVDLLENSPKVAFVSCIPRTYIQETEPIVPKELIKENFEREISPDKIHMDGKLYFLNFMTKSPVVLFSATLFRRQLAIDRNWAEYGCLDQSLALLLAANNEVVFYKDSLVCYRKHNSPSLAEVPIRVSSPTDLALTSYEDHVKWVAFARQSLKISYISRQIWRFKTLISKEGFSFRHLYEADPNLLTEFLQQIKKQNYVNYFVLRWLEPWLIAHDAEKKPGNPMVRAFHHGTIILRTRISALMVALDRQVHDPDYHLTISQIFRWMLTGRRKKGQDHFKT
ncbi:MAG: glycosyltransferase family 2 protein [Proteobacteria bacterium]|nr:glycosyltransferase family 2 protein [Pseudomonadota bacterium]